MCRSCRIVTYIYTCYGGLQPPSPCYLYLTFLPMLSLPNLPISHCPSPNPPQQTLVCDAPLPVSMCSHCSTPTYEWEHVIFDSLFLCQFAENDGFQIHPCPYKGHELIYFYGCIVFHGVYVPHFPCTVYPRLAFGLVPGICYCKQCCNKYMCACVFVTQQFIILWIYTQ